MKKQYLFLWIIFLYSFSLLGKEGYRIEIQLENYPNDTLLLGYYYGDKQYIKDTAIVNAQNQFVFEGEEGLSAGVYLLVLLPGKNYLNVLIEGNAQHFSIATDTEALIEEASITNSKDNLLFYNYLKFINKQRVEKERLLSQKETTKREILQELEAKIKTIDQLVISYQQQLIAKEPTTLTAAFIKNYISTPPPTFEGTEEEIQLQQYGYARDHYFDNINLGDARLLRTPFLHQRIDYFTSKLTYQHPDSIAKSLDIILDKTIPAKETFKYYLHHFYNTYANAKIVGMDAVCVHLADKYFSVENTPWIEEEQLAKIKKTAATLKPILIGKVAPDLSLYEIDVEKTIEVKAEENPYKRWRAKRSIRLHEVDAAYTVVYIWAPDCGVCRKATPKMLDFYEKFKDKGVEVFSICTENVQTDLVACAESIKEKGMIHWINTFDPFYKSKFKSIYDVTGTPKIFILDENKEIIMKGIGADQLPQIMEEIMLKK